MAQYCVNARPQSTGEHEVHNLETCPVLPEPRNRIPLGNHATCHGAVKKAKEQFPTADGCRHCSPQCHTR